ncbi:BTB/POZ and MATH domain-containing protein 1-like [Brachypodium distachyon]|uniref:BTB domain-containing protein n=1 Tax=Brachypodium distachyon TaxID=15368 RepID=I1I8X6_BRADI|nr:BTB/POZ and MATH domain-containing protein 1-like [Brachypodium distachyon]KQJ99132.1 hypothetical protein BRADI_3g41290v3 [Brachypodium distachyon]|eukprot:XP_024317767.1 BTB/POZ and MATH domain-containing protein 1-like [Brachypodium distachyon]
MVGSVVQLKVNYEKAKNGKAIHSDVVSVGGHLWRIDCHPRGVSEDCKSEFISILLQHMSKSGSVTAIFESFLMDRDGQPSSKYQLRSLPRSYQSDSWGWGQFIGRTTLEKDYLEDGHFSILCTIMITDDSSIPVPPSDIGTHLGSLLDRADRTDVAFIVDGETFHAHRAVLAARSPVFRAELFGSMAEATMPAITLHEIVPRTFEVMLWFIYTDALPGDKELSDSSIEMFQNLLGAADRYALDRLKFICAQKLWEKVSVDTVSTILACAETYECPELKNRCIDLFVAE